LRTPHKGSAPGQTEAQKVGQESHHQNTREPAASARARAGGFAAAKEGWLKLVASYPNLSGADVAVAVMLASYMNTRSRDAWPSMERLARDINRSRSTVLRSLQRLEKLKLLDITHARSRRKPNRYRPLLGKINAKPERLKRKTTPRGLMMRTRTVNDANSHNIVCELASRTLEEPQMKSRSRTPDGARDSSVSVSSRLVIRGRRP
jgi:hypothetical protein